MDALLFDPKLSTWKGGPSFDWLSDDTARPWLMCFLAGPIAESRVRHASKRHTMESVERLVTHLHVKTERERLLAALLLLKFGFNLAALVQETNRCLRDWWPGILQVARVLDTRQQLDPRDLRRILRSATATRWS